MDRRAYMHDVCTSLSLPLLGPSALLGQHRLGPGRDGRGVGEQQGDARALEVRGEGRVVDDDGEGERPLDEVGRPRGRLEQREHAVEGDQADVDRGDGALARVVRPGVDRRAHHLRDHRQQEEARRADRVHRPVGLRVERRLADDEQEARGAAEDGRLGRLAPAAHEPAARLQDARRHEEREEEPPLRLLQHAVGDVGQIGEPALLVAAQDGEEVCGDDGDRAEDGCARGQGRRGHRGGGLAGCHGGRSPSWAADLFYPPLRCRRVHSAAGVDHSFGIPSGAALVAIGRAAGG
mmetsp:Transcript_44562/g.147726  ORF Transcript_44562/g.147726 Transcript_44562/m.147726 type:complete len:293 (-) Transcript_44562:10-888(-)